MAKILLIGCGKLGSAIAFSLHDAGHDVIGVRKSNKPLVNGIETIQADVGCLESLEVLKSVCPQIVIYCVAAAAQNDESYYQHYVVGLKNILETLHASTQLEHVFFVSSTRVYGESIQGLVDEDVTAVASDYGGNRLLEAEQLLLKLKCAHTVLRLSGIYGPERLHLLKLAKDVGRWPEENNWTNRIHQDDAVAFISCLVKLHVSGRQLAPCYIVTDGSSVQQYEVLAWLAKKQGIDVGRMGWPSVCKGKRLDNAKMKSLGFKLKYPTYQDGYEAVLASL